MPPVDDSVDQSEDHCHKDHAENEELKSQILVLIVV